MILLDLPVTFVWFAFTSLHLNDPDIAICCQSLVLLLWILDFMEAYKMYYND